MTPRLIPLVLVVLVLAGCADSGGTLSLSSPSPSVTGSPSASATASDQATPTPTATVAAKPVLVLEPDGLGVLTGGSSIRHLTFAETSAADVTAALVNLLGAGKTTSLPECGQGPRSTYQVKGFSVLLDGTKFVGWTDSGAPDRTLSSADGVAIGITLEELQRIRPGVMVNNESLEEEFFESDTSINGFLDGLEASSKVTSLYAGETCFFR